MKDFSKEPENHKAFTEKMNLEYNRFARIYDWAVKAFSGYPDEILALRELKRVINPRGKLIPIDFVIPENKNFAGNLLERIMAAAGDIIRDLPALFRKEGFVFNKKKIGGFGSVELYIAEKQ